MSATLTSSSAYTLTSSSFILGHLALMISISCKCFDLNRLSSYFTSGLVDSVRHCRKTKLYMKWHLWSQSCKILAFLSYDMLWSYLYFSFDAFDFSPASAFKRDSTSECHIELRCIILPSFFRSWNQNRFLIFCVYSLKCLTLRTISSSWHFLTR